MYQIRHHEHLKRPSFGAWAALAAIVPTLSALAQTATFQGIGDLPGGAFFSQALGLSSDGSTVVGQSTSSSGNGAVRWRSGTLSSLSGSPQYSAAYNCTPNGDLVAGYGTGGPGVPTIWNDAGNPTALGWLPCGNNGSALGISSDGSVVVGYTNSCQAPAYNAFRWTQATGLVSLGDIPGGQFASVARNVSADGSVVVGNGSNASGSAAWRWTQATGMVDLGYLAGGTANASAWGVSRDGEVVVGVSASAAGNEAFMWSQSQGMTSLGDLPGGAAESMAFAISDDYQVVIGYGTSAAGQRAMVWDSVHGMRDLRTVLTNDFGLNLSGWTLSTSIAVSADGATIAGTGVNPSGQTEGWIARVPCFVGPDVHGQPTDMTTCSNGTTFFNVGVSGTGSLTYQWQVESPESSGTYVDITAPTLIEPTSGLTFDVSAVTTDTLSVSNITLGAHANILRFRAAVSNACGSVTSDAATLTVCAADYDCNTFVNGDDFDQFVYDFEYGLPAADVNHDTFVSGEDFDYFVEHFEAGC